MNRRQLFALPMMLVSAVLPAAPVVKRRPDIEYNQEYWRALAFVEQNSPYFENNRVAWSAFKCVNVEPKVGCTHSIKGSQGRYMRNDVYLHNGTGWVYVRAEFENFQGRMLATVLTGWPSLQRGEAQGLVVIYYPVLAQNTNSGGNIVKAT